MQREISDLLARVDARRGAIRGPELHALAGLLLTTTPPPPPPPPPPHPAPHYDQHMEEQFYSDAEYDNSFINSIRPLPHRTKEEDVLLSTKALRHEFRKSNPGADDFRHMTTLLICEVIILCDELKASMDRDDLPSIQRGIIDNILVHTRTFLKNEGLIKTVNHQ